ncbi:hypothetical protein ATANTOWER_000191 [Ataeniobius toweri]|uniref:Uncharacterized protein n=1 Tax=Ataeniobius toweri TaxID=208326 RepID=A0ABU7BAG3_9TELE|nr:hypothetical protein [Ataeniobius toweri]
MLAAQLFFLVSLLFVIQLEQSRGKDISLDAEKHRGSNEVITSSPVLETELDQDSSIGYKGISSAQQKSL